MSTASRKPESCTSSLQKWNQPHKRKLDACDIDDTVFVKYEYGEAGTEYSHGRLI